MRREILFRGYQKELKKWVFGSLIKTSNGGCWIFDWKDNFENRIQIVPESVGQYTGSNTQFGDKIFEGDIVDKKYKWIVEFEDDTYVVKNQRLKSCPLCEMIRKRRLAGVPLEIIGNIYENSNIIPMPF